MSNPVDTLNTLGEAPNNTIAQGIINLAVVQGATTSKWNVRSGGESQTIFKGPQDQIVDVARSCQKLGYEYSIQGGHVWSITITFPVDIIVNALNNEPAPLTIWELNYHPVKQNLLEASDRIFVGRLGYKTKLKIDVAIKSDSQTLPLVDISDINKPYLSAKVAYNLKKIGVEGKNVFVPTLKRSSIFSNANNPNIAPPGTISPWTSFTNGNLWTTDQLLQTYNPPALPKLQQIPSFIVNQLPYQLPAVIWLSNLNLPVEQPIEGYSIDQNGIVTYVGWLEYPPEYQTISLNKVQASQQWQFFKYSAGTYGLYDPVLDGNGPYPGAPNGPLPNEDGVSAPG